jgi:hypothetical protein
LLVWHGRLELFIANIDLSVTAHINTVRIAAESCSTTSLFLGLDDAFQISEHVSWSFYWTRNDNVGDEHGYGGYDDEEYEDDEGGFDVDRLSVSAPFWF